MPQWAGSCWYYLRYLDPNNDRMLVDPEIERAWMPVDLYVGGAEHAVLHLLYARFWHKVLYDRGYVTTKEPFRKLVNQGMILGEMEFTGYKTPDGVWVSAEGVEVDGSKAFRKSDRLELEQVKLIPNDLTKKGESFVLVTNPSIAVEGKSYKMSKSRGNVINPDDVVAQYGADALRLYEMFMGPLESVKSWSQDGVVGVYGFLRRVWRMVVDWEADDDRCSPAVSEVEPTAEQNRVLHKTILAVTADIENMSFNTAIARMMEFVNFFGREKVRPKKAIEDFILLLAPFAPHIAEELWQRLGHDESLIRVPWPVGDESASPSRLSRFRFRSTANFVLRLNCLSTQTIRRPKRSLRPIRKLPQRSRGKRLSRRLSFPTKWSISLSAEDLLPENRRSVMYRVARVRLLDSVRCRDIMIESKMWGGILSCRSTWRKRWGRFFRSLFLLPTGSVKFYGFTKGNREKKWKTVGCLNDPGFSRPNS